MQIDVARMHISQITSRFCRVPRILFLSDKSDISTLPEDIQSLFTKVDLNKGNLTVQGGYLGPDVDDLLDADEPALPSNPILIYLVLSEIHDIEELTQVFLHELIGHYAVTHAMAERLVRQAESPLYPLARDLIKKQKLNEFDLFSRHIIPISQQKAQARNYKYPLSFLSRLHYSLKVRKRDGKGFNPLITSITALMLKKVFARKATEEIVAFRTNDLAGASHHDIDTFIRNLNEPGVINGRIIEPDLFTYVHNNGQTTVQSLSALNTCSLETWNTLIRVWLLRPALQWLMPAA